MDYKIVATKVGDLLKYSTSCNQIDRYAESVFEFKRDNFLCESITSSRAITIYQWILTLAHQQIDEQKKQQQLKTFLKLITPQDQIKQVDMILKEAGFSSLFDNESIKEFYERNFHRAIHEHCLNLYKQGNYFHAVFEASKVYNLMVKQKAGINNKDGVSLMMEAWGVNGVLKVTSCITETDRNFQEGLKFLSAGLMQAIRNPTAHEPAIYWPISKEDCLDLLSFISYLLRQIDKSVVDNNQR